MGKAAIVVEALRVRCQGDLWHRAAWILLRMCVRLGPIQILKEGRVHGSFGRVMWELLDWVGA